MNAAAIPTDHPITPRSETVNASHAAIWTGRALSGLASLFMVLDGMLHVFKPQPVIEAFAQLGYPINASVALGVIALACVALYNVRRTAVLGAILLTAYLGGAIATQVRIEAPFFSTILFPVYVAGMFWGGLFLRGDARVRAIVGR
jgi:DoxX-like family